MTKKDVKIEYKDTWIDISVPGVATVVQYGTPAFPRIPVHPNPEKAVKEALRKPIGMERVSELVKKGSKVTVAFDDPIKHPDSIKIIIPIVVEELIKAGVKEENIKLTCATGVHCKWQPNELRNLIGASLYDRFHPFSWRDGAVLNHDCTQNNVYLGETNLGDEVEYDNILVESDLVIYVGTIYPVPYGGYAGQGVAIGLGSMRALNSLHSYDVYKGIASLHGDYRPEKNLYRKHKLAVHEQIEKATGKKIFYVDAITGPEEKIVSVFAGHVPDLEKIEYPEADNYFKIRVPQVDIVVLGMPHTLDYDTSDNPGCACNFAARPARMWQNKPLLRENGVTIVLGQCKGAMSSRRPADPAAYRLYQDCFGGEELFDYVDAFCNNEEYLYKYRYHYAYSPIHSIFLMANMDTLQKVSRQTIFAGEVNPGTIRNMGAIPARDFDEALAKATEIVGMNADILVLPSYSRDPKPIFEVI
jgi:nickel-dependent lactate racemase